MGRFLSSCDKASGVHQSVDHTLLELGIADFGEEERKKLVQIKVFPSLCGSRRRGDLLEESLSLTPRDLPLLLPSVA